MYVYISHTQFFSKLLLLKKNQVIQRYSVDFFMLFGEVTCFLQKIP